ncbi:putative transcriptional regulator [Bradyrhizobium sp. S3.2.6]
MAIRAGSGNAHENLATRLVALDAAIARGLDDAETGRVKPISEVFDRLEAEFTGNVDQT